MYRRVAPAIAVTLAAAAAAAASPPPDVELWEMLAAGAEAPAVAAHAGCAGVAELDAYLTDDGGASDFAIIQAPFSAIEASEPRTTRTPLRAEFRGLRASTPFARFRAAAPLRAPARFAVNVSLPGPGLTPSFRSIGPSGFGRQSMTDPFDHHRMRFSAFGGR